MYLPETSFWTLQFRVDKLCSASGMKIVSGFSLTVRPLTSRLVQTLQARRNITTGIIVLPVWQDINCWRMKPTRESKRKWVATRCRLISQQELPVQWEPTPQCHFQAGQSKDKHPNRKIAYNDARLERSEGFLTPAECANASCNKAAILECAVRTLERNDFYIKVCQAEIKRATEENKELEKDLEAIRTLLKGKFNVGQEQEQSPGTHNKAEGNMSRWTSSDCAVPFMVDTFIRTENVFLMYRTGEHPDGLSENSF